MSGLPHPNLKTEKAIFTDFTVSSHFGDTSSQTLSCLIAIPGLFQNMFIEPLLGDTVEYRIPPLLICCFVCHGLPQPGTDD